MHSIIPVCTQKIPECTFVERIIVVAPLLNSSEKLRVAWLKGDGIGLDVMEAARIVLSAIDRDIEYIEADIGWNYWCNEGNALPERTLQTLRYAHCAVMGPTVSKPRHLAREELAPELLEHDFTYVSPVVKLRQHFELNTRRIHCKSYAGNKLNHTNDIDLALFIENHEGLYSGVEFPSPLPKQLHKMLVKGSRNYAPFRNIAAADLAISCRILSREGCTSLMKQAFQYAEEKGKAKVTVADKPSVMEATGSLMMECALDVAQYYPSIRLETMDVDKLCMIMLRKPSHYEVIVASSLMGTIIGDVAVELSGGLSIAPTVSLGSGFAVFTPYHGAAPRFAGQYKVNPLGAILSVAEMLEWSCGNEPAEKVRTAVARVIESGHVLTYDLGGTASTVDVAEAVREEIVNS